MNHGASFHNVFKFAVCRGVDGPHESSERVPDTISWCDPEVPPRTAITQSLRYSRLTPAFRSGIIETQARKDQGYEAGSAITVDNGDCIGFCVGTGTGSSDHGRPTGKRAIPVSSGVPNALGQDRGT